MNNKLRVSTGFDGSNPDGGDSLPDLPRKEIRVNNQSIRQIKITQLDHGYTVNIDCHAFAIETREKLLSKLSEYITNPEETEKKFREGDLL